ncbi:hypothetical protein [Lentzea sp. E54]|uniref:hypothetical protein n=1 Tax=Lentzea xerophila TaxID=3435883 RepID=UPI003DA4D7EF
MITDPRRLARLLRRADPAVYPGTFATCVYNPDTALCHPSRDSRGTTTPTLGDCRPLDCANTALTTDNLTALRAELDHLNRELTIRPALPPLLRHRLHDRRHRLDTFLRRHTPETP